MIFPFNIPTLSGFGAASGFNFLIQDRTGTMTVEELGEQADRSLPPDASEARARQPLYFIRSKLSAGESGPGSGKSAHAGSPVNEVFQTMSTAMGGAFVNDFNRFGRLYRVYVQAESSDRLKSSDIGRIYVRSRTTNSMVPLSTLVNITDIAGTELTTRFNLLRSVELQGRPRRLHVRPGAGGARRSLCADYAEGDEFLLLVALVSGEDRATTRTDFHHGNPLRLSVARRDV